MGTGLIYAAIVAAWAAYLVPGWIRRHEEVADAAPVVDRAPPPVRVLERRHSGRGATADLSRDATGDDERRPPGYGPPRSGAARPSSVVRRRRRVLVGLIGLTTVVAVLGAFRLAPWWALAVPVGIVAAYLLICAVLARGHRSQGVRAVASASPSSATEGKGATRASGSARSGRAPAAHGVVRTTAARLAETADCPVPDARTVSVRVDPSFGAGAGAGGGGVPAAREPTDPGLWDPVQVPLPTYVTKAKATRTVRTVELGEPGTWSSGRLPEAELLSRPEESVMLLDETEQPGPAPDEAQSDAGESERRRAVGD
ncbi:hypothetical protein ABN028_28945 [Actinopolymorpha sp. B17G11]|uniref:divisome protein SepX/GlpR n=1 Tax=Actinopolymorpha sp. B17G11 TaxID=3160861 RepID=UPI0032E406F1